MVDVRDIDVKIRVQRGKIHRNLAKVGSMDPFVVLSPNNIASKTARAKIAKADNMISAADSGGHQTPKWNWDFPMFKLGASGEIILDVYDRNQYHKNTFIGTAQVGLSEVCIGSRRMVKDYPCSVNKRGEETGILWITVICSSADDRDIVSSLTRSENLKGHDRSAPSENLRGNRTASSSPSENLRGHHSSAPLASENLGAHRMARPSPSENLKGHRRDRARSVSPSPSPKSAEIARIEQSWSPGQLRRHNRHRGEHPKAVQAALQDSRSARTGESDALTDIYPQSMGSVAVSLPSGAIPAYRGEENTKIKQWSCIDTLGKYLYCK